MISSFDTSNSRTLASSFCPSNISETFMITLGNLITSSFKDYLMLTDFPSISKNNDQQLEKSYFSPLSRPPFFLLLLPFFTT